MNNLDFKVNVVLNITDPYSEYTNVLVEVPYLDKTYEVKIPTNAQEGYTTRLKGLGIRDNHGNVGDVLVIVTEIIDPRRKIVKQKLLTVYNNNFDFLNALLSEGWCVKEFKPWNSNGSTMVYVLIEKR